MSELLPTGLPLPRREECRQDVVSRNGEVTFNHLQQDRADSTERAETPLERIGTTDPLGITDE